MKLKLTAIEFYFDAPEQGPAAYYMVKYEPQDTPGTYVVNVFMNANYLISFDCYGSANKSHAKEFVERAIEWQKEKANL